MDSALSYRCRNGSRIVADHARHGRKAWAECPGHYAHGGAYDNGGGEIGLILAVTQPFYPPCHSGPIVGGGSDPLMLICRTGVNLRDLLRATDLEIATTVPRLWSGRDDRHSELRSLKVVRVNARTVSGRRVTSC